MDGSLPVVDAPQACCALRRALYRRNSSKILRLWKGSFPLLLLILFYLLILDISLILYSTKKNLIVDAQEATQRNDLVGYKFCDNLYSSLNANWLFTDTQPFIVTNKHGSKYPFWIQCQKISPQTSKQQAINPLLASNQRYVISTNTIDSSNHSIQFSNITISRPVSLPVNIFEKVLSDSKRLNSIPILVTSNSVSANKTLENSTASLSARQYLRLTNEETARVEYIIQVAQKCESQLTKICQSYRMGLLTQKSTRCPTCGLGDLNCDNVHLCSSDCGQIKSVNYPLNYANNHRCRWSIRAPESYYVNLSIIDFDIPSANNASKLGTCIFDYLTLIDGYTGKRLGCYCNENLPPPYILSPWNELIIQFDTNSETTGRGFYFQYEFIKLELTATIKLQLKPHRHQPPSAATSPSYTRGQDRDDDSSRVACPSSWQYFRGSCYRAYNEDEPLQWYDAENKCNAYGKGLDGHLVSILDRDEMLVIHYLLTNVWKSARYRDYYIGLIDVSREGVYRWSDNNPMSYTDWQLKPILLEEEQAAQPDGGAYEDCTIIRFNSFSGTSNWHDVPCSLGKHFHFLLDKSLHSKYKWDYVDSYICKSDSFPLMPSSRSKVRRPLFSNEFIRSLQNKLSLASNSHGSNKSVLANDSFLWANETVAAFTGSQAVQRNRFLLSTLDDNKYFVCDNLEVISVVLRCDGITHCRDGSDESEANGCNQDCLDWQYKCANGRCISIGSYCDFVDDCGDKSDESHCERHRCKLNEFRCQNGQCIPSSQRCDLLPDCNDSSDEGRLCNIGSNCNSYSTFQCYYGNCIPQYAVCDFQTDCPGKFHEDEDAVKCDLIAKSRTPVFNYHTASTNQHSSNQLTGRELLLSQLRNFNLIENCHQISSLLNQSATSLLTNASNTLPDISSPPQSSTIHLQQQLGEDTFCVKPNELTVPSNEISMLDNVIYTCKQYIKRHCNDLHKFYNASTNGFFDIQPDPFDKTCQVECVFAHKKQAMSQLSLSSTLSTSSNQRQHQHQHQRQAVEPLTLVHHDSEFVLHNVLPLKGAQLAFAVATSAAAAAIGAFPTATSLNQLDVAKSKFGPQVLASPPGSASGQTTGAGASASGATALPVNYDTSMDIISSLISQSASCSQSIQWKCFTTDGRQVNCINQIATLTSSAPKSTRAHSLSSLTSTANASQRVVSFQQVTSSSGNGYAKTTPTSSATDESSAAGVGSSPTTDRSDHYEQLEASSSSKSTSERHQTTDGRLSSMTLAEISIGIIELTGKNISETLSNDNIHVKTIPNYKLSLHNLTSSNNANGGQTSEWSEVVIKNKYRLPIVKANFRQTFIENVGSPKSVQVKQVVYRISPMVCFGSAKLNNSLVTSINLTGEAVQKTFGATDLSSPSKSEIGQQKQLQQQTTQQQQQQQQQQQEKHQIDIVEDEKLNLNKFATQFIEAHDLRPQTDEAKYAKLMLGDGQTRSVASSVLIIDEPDEFKQQQPNNVNQLVSLRNQRFLDSEAVCEPFKQNLFKCTSGNMIDNNWRCLYEFDKYGYQIGCRDVSHLLDCADFECPPRDYVKCSNSYCIPRRYICDGKWDCIMGDDEIGCARYVCPGQYKCANQSSCILLHQLCDGHRQCPMGDDEWFCDLQCPSQCDCIGQSVNCRNASLTVLPANAISKSVRKLDLSYNNFGPNLSSCDLSSFRDLGELILQHNVIEVLIPRKFHQLRNLYKLDLSHNQIHSVKRGAFAGLRRVTQLLLESNPELVVLEPEAFLGLSSLQILNMSSSRIHALKKNTFDGLTSLRHLLLRNNMIVDIEDGAFRSLTSLVSLDLRGNEIRYFTKSVFSELKTLRNLSTDSFKFCCLMSNQISSDRCLPPPDEISDCEDLMSSVLQRACIWVAGVMACIGNSIVIVWRYRDRLIGKDREEELINSTLLLSLGFSDLLMGIYLIIIAFVDIWYRGRYIENADNWRQSALCNLCGFLSTVSSEASVFTLVYIALNRFIEICHPFSSPYKFTLTWTHRLVIASWITALAIAGLPLLVTPYFKSQFYARSGVCLPFHITNQKAAGWEYSIVVFLCVNFIAFIIIVTCYTFMYREISRAARQSGTRPSHPVKIALIVITNFIAWSPTIIMGFIALAGHAFPTSVYSWIAVLVLPVNSAINPMIYTIPSIRHQIKTLVNNHRARKSGAAVSAVAQASAATANGLSVVNPKDKSLRNVPPGYQQLSRFMLTAREVNASHLVNIALEISKDIEQKHLENKVYNTLNVNNVYVSDCIGGEAGKLRVFLTDYDGYRQKRSQCNEHHHKHKNTVSLSCGCSDVNKFGDILLRLYTYHKLPVNRTSSVISNGSVGDGKLSVVTNSSTAAAAATTTNGSIKD